MFGKDTVFISLKLFVITAIAAFCLAFVNKVTAPVIAENSARAEEEALRVVLEEAESFKASDITETSVQGVALEKINIGLKGSETVGYVVTAVSSEGYGGDIRVMVGIDKKLAVTKIQILESSETAGLGANASKPEFSGQFEKKNGPFAVVKGAAAKETEISAISSATVTTKAVTSCVNAALEAAAEKQESGAERNVEETAKAEEEIKQQTIEQIEGGAEE